MDLLSKYRKQVERQLGKKKLLKAQFQQSKKKQKKLTKKLSNHEKAREVIRAVGLQTQKQLQFHVSDISTLALEAIFGDEAYQLKVNFLQRRNKTECDIVFERDGNEVDPLTATGGGAVDVAAFALRVASWCMRHPSLRPTIILDEPFKNLDKKRQERASQMIKQLSNQLNLQFIIVTHEPVLIGYADKAFRVTIKKRISKVKVIEN